jgi:uncharacterized protein (TIGR00251 family)
MKKTITVKVKPGARKREIFETREGLLVHLTSPPEKGKANEELIEVLSEHFRTAKSRINIKKGKSSRIKVIEIDMV